MEVSAVLTDSPCSGLGGGEDSGEILKKLLTFIKLFFHYYKGESFYTKSALYSCHSIH